MVIEKELSILKVTKNCDIYIVIINDIFLFLPVQFLIFQSMTMQSRDDSTALAYRYCNRHWEGVEYRRRIYFLSLDNQS